MKKLMLALFLAGVFLLTDSSPDPSLAQKASNVPAGARQELMKAANAHRVKIKADEINYVSNQQMTIIHAPIQGSEKYKDADYEKGAPLVLAIVRASEKFVVPSGSYVVKLLYPPDAVSGKAIFTDPMGKVIGEQGLNKPLFPVGGELPEPCRVDHYPRLVRTSPGPLPRPGGGTYGIDLPCFSCACTHYRWLKTPNKGEDQVAIGARDITARMRADAFGMDCESAVTPTCPALEVPRP